MSAAPPATQPFRFDHVLVNGARLAVGYRPGVPASGAEPDRGVVLLHGWPGTGGDWHGVAERLAADSRWRHVTLICPDLRGYGESDKPSVDLTAEEPYTQYTPVAQTADVASLIDHYSLGEVLIGGYDIGANIAQGLARPADATVCGLVLCDPVHAAARAQAGQVNQSLEVWYQALHVLPWSADLIAHDRRTLEIYLRHFYTHWWGDGRVDESHFQAIVDQYNAPGAFEASIAWYRSRARTRMQEAKAAAGAALIAEPTQVLWGARDPITPIVFADSLDRSFSDFELTRLEGIGHFVPLEAPAAVTDAFGRLAERLGWWARRAD